MRIPEIDKKRIENMYNMHNNKGEEQKIPEFMRRFCGNDPPDFRK